MSHHMEKAEEAIKHTETWSFPVDVYENDNELRLVADLPGVPAESVDVQLNGGELTIRAHQEQAVGSERTYERSFRVRVPLDSNAVSARMDAGVLTVTLAKSEAVRPRKVPVQAA